MMMLLKLLFIFALLFANVEAFKFQETEKNASFCVETVWQSYVEKYKCYHCKIENDTWQEGVQEYYDGCRNASDNFRGQAYSIADVTVKMFEDYIVKLIYFSTSNSTVLPSNSTAILDSISKCNNLRKSGLIIMEEFNKVLPELVEDFKEIAKKLENFIGQLTYSFNDEFDDFADVFSSFMNEFLNNSKAPPTHRKEVNFEPVFKQCQKLMNTVALIAETLLNECELATREVHEAVTVLGLIFHHFALAVQGINSCAQDFLYVQKFSISQNIKSCSESFEYVLIEVSQAISAVVFPFTRSIDELLTILVNVTIAFNTAVKDILGVFEGVSITVDRIKQNLSKCVNKSVTGVAKTSTNILKGIAPK